MARVYAETTDAWPTDAPANADELLRAASRVVDQLLIGTAYDVDSETELPTDPDDAAAMSEAVVAIALEAQAQGLLDAGGTREWQSVSIGSVSLSGPVSTDDGYVLGLPVPPAARLALLDVGESKWWIR